MSFEAFDESLRLVRLLRPLLSRLRSRDPDLYRQLRKAGSSQCLNLAEGAGREGRDRRHHYRIARGSVMETEAILLVAEAWGHLAGREIAPAMASVELAQADVGADALSVVAAGPSSGGRPLLLTLSLSLSSPSCSASVADPAAAPGSSAGGSEGDGGGGGCSR